MDTQPRKAVEEIYEHYSSTLFGVILNMTKDQQLSEDILQESFVKIYNKLSLYDQQKARLFTWLIRICRNTTIDYLRKRNKGRTVGTDLLDNTINWSERPSRSEFFDLKGHVENLNPKYQSVVDLLYFQGLSHQEASEALEIPLGTVKTRIRGALKLLRKLYRSEVAIIILILIII